MVELSPRTFMASLILAATILLGAAALRGAEYDEAYTVFLASGTARPDWPEAPFTVAEAWTRLAGHSSLGGIAADLRRTDVHPPLYFWMVAAWRGAIGMSLFATRSFSVLCALGALVLVGAIARQLAVPVMPALLITLGCYGFVYTGAIARGFAMAQLLNLAGVWVLLRARRRSGHCLGGVLLGAASLTNYLAGFVGVAALTWAALTRARANWLPAMLGFVLLMPAGLWFFLAQRGSRVEQFPPFAWGPSLGRLAQYAAANILGGLPLYAGDKRVIVSWVLAGILIVFAGLLAWRWRQIGGRGLLGLCAISPAFGLLGLGVIFDTTPIELRYMAFAAPFVALLLAGLIGALPTRLARWVLGGLLGVQALSIAGLLTRAETMQPQARVIHEAAALVGSDGLVLLARGNDGVGLVGSVLMAAPAELRLHLASPHTDPARLRAVAGPYPRVVLALLAPDAESRATLAPMTAAFADHPCWRPGQVASGLRLYDRVCRE